MNLWEVPGQLFRLAWKVEDIFQLQEETKTALRAVDQRLHQLEARLTHLEADRGQMVTEAKAAAGMAASGIASAIAGSMLAETVTRVTRLEMRADDAAGPAGKAITKD